LKHRRNVSAEYFSLEHTNFDHAVACIDIRSVVVAGVGDLQDNSNVLPPTAATSLVSDSVTICEDPSNQRTAES
jgi:hypothetical protein